MYITFLVCMFTFLFVYIHIFVCMFTYFCVYIHIFSCVYSHFCVCLYSHFCVCIHIFCGYFTSFCVFQVVSLVASWRRTPTFMSRVELWHRVIFTWEEQSSSKTKLLMLEFWMLKSTILKLWLHVSRVDSNLYLTL